MTSVSTVVANREQVSVIVRKAIELHGPSVFKTLGPVLFPDGVPETLTIEDLFNAFSTALENSTQKMHQADINLANETADDPPKRTKRDESSALLSTELRDQRDLIGATYGPDLIPEYNLVTNIPTRHDVLLNLADSVVSALRKRPFDIDPKPGRSGLDASALADHLEKVAASLRVSLDDVNTEKKEYQLALEERDQTVETWLRTYRGVAGAVSSLFDLAGRDELAARVRPTARRRAGNLEGDDQEPT